MQNAIVEPIIEITTETHDSSESWVKFVCSWFFIGGLAWLLWWGSSFSPWLTNRIGSTPTAYIKLWGILIALVILSDRFAETIWNGYKTACLWILNAIERKPFYSFFIIVCAASLSFGYFRIQRLDAGDILEWVMAGIQGRAFLVEHAPLETVIRCWLSEIHRFWPSADLLVFYKTLVCLYGGVFVWVVLWFSSRMSRPYNLLTPLFFFATASTSVYFGYLEIYGATNLMQTVFLLTAFRCFQGKTSITWASFWYGLAIAMGFWHGILLPAYLFLLWRARRSMRWIDWPLQGLLISLPAALALIGLIPYANPFAGIVTRMSEPSVLIPFSPHAKAIGYTLWGKTHLADWATETMLIVPITLILLIARFFCDFKGVKNTIRQPAFRFAVIAAAACYAFGFVYHPVLGFPLDWDLYTFMYPSFGLCGVTLMNDVERSKLWRKRLIVLVLAAVALASCWILQNALFWRYPLMLTKVGPVAAPLIPDFYYKNMQRAFERSNQANLYWMADRALEESPELYRDILTFMDDWTVSTLSKVPPQPFDYPGWACDLALMPGGGYRAIVFDKLGRLFLYNGQALKWLFAPGKRLDSPVVAGDVEADGSAVYLCEDGSIYRIARETIDKGMNEVVWINPTLVQTYLPDSPSKRDLPVRMVDIAVRPGDGAICVLDNFNRVWDTNTKALLLQGEASYNLVQSLHFNYNKQPLTVDVNDRLSYDSDKTKIPFPVAWFHPIVRDFLFTPDETGLMVLDLNGNVHYMGSTPIYKDIVQPGAIIDRYKKMTYLPDRDALLLLDNRYRLHETGLDSDGSTARRKISNMIDTGNYATAFKILSVLWRRSSVFTSICYDLIDTDVIRDIPGSVMYVPEDAIQMYVDLIPIEDDLSVLVDRWGRLVAYNKGVLVLLEGSGLASWPRSEATDGAYADGSVFFLCRDGSVWRYEFDRFFGQQTSPFERTPALWKNLNDYQEGERWIGVEPAKDGRELVVMSASGLLLRLSPNDGMELERSTIPIQGKPVFDFDYKSSFGGYAVAYTSTDGPAYVYTERDGTNREAPNSNFGWPVIADVCFSKDEDIVLLDKYGVIHQYDTVYLFTQKPYSVIMDAAAFRFLPTANHALWMRSNGEILTVRLKEK